jgi:NAD(P)-dependent dehydrogenase (short-subunit alcohol dehydrogenase family)
LQKRIDGRTALVTGASRGIGAEVARLLAARGADVAINYRSKESRAAEIADEVRARERRAVLVQSDLTDSSSVEQMMRTIGQEFGCLDILILNASGGLEKDKPDSYAMELNLTAQVRTLDAVLPLMPAGGCIVFVTSHWAHFYGQKPVYASYEKIAASKKAGEEALRERIPELTTRNLRLAIVSGDIIEGTITPKLLERSQPGMMAARREQTGALPTVHDFAAAIVDAACASDEPTGRVYFVGPTD